MNDDDVDFSAGIRQDMMSRARGMTRKQLRTLGMSNLAYCRLVEQEGTTMVVIHAADGTPMGIVDDEESAAQAIVDHDLTPALLH